MSAQDDLNAAALAYAVSQGYTKPAPPPPIAVPLFDGRALIAPQPFPTTTGLATAQNPNGWTQTPPSPTGLWDGYLYQGSDIAVVDDPRWGKAYKVAPAAGHRSPSNYLMTPENTFAQVTKRRDTGLGQTFYWSESINVLASDVPDGGSMLSLGYQTVAYDQIGFGVGNTGVSGNTWSIRLNSGLVTNGKPAVSITQGLKPVTLGKWADWIIGAHIAADSSGSLEVHYRPEGGTWSQVYAKTGVPTVEWQNATGTPNVGATVLDKAGLYFWWWQQGRTPAPTGVLLMRGLQRWGTLADAKASLF